LPLIHADERLLNHRGHRETQRRTKNQKLIAEAAKERRGGGERFDRKQKRIYAKTEKFRISTTEKIKTFFAADFR
jgi:hypothetical protein